MGEPFSLATALGVIQTIQAGATAASVAEANARILEQQAAAAQQQAAVEEDRIRRETSQKLSRFRAITASSGVRLEGSPLLVIQEKLALGEFDALTARYRGQLRSQDELTRARLARARGRNDLTGSLFKVGSTLLPT